MANKLFRAISHQASASLPLELIYILFSNYKEVQYLFLDKAKISGPYSQRQMALQILHFCDWKTLTLNNGHGYLQVSIGAHDSV